MGTDWIGGSEALAGDSAEARVEASASGFIGVTLGALDG